MQNKTESACLLFSQFCVQNCSSAAWLLLSPSSRLDGVLFCYPEHRRTPTSSALLHLPPAAQHLVTFSPRSWLRGAPIFLSVFCMARRPGAPKTRHDTISDVGLSFRRPASAGRRNQNPMCLFSFSLNFIVFFSETS